MRRAQQWCLRLPPGTANDPPRPFRGSLRITGRAILIIVRVVPVRHPFPHIALEVLHAFGARSLRMASNRFQCGSITPLVQVIGEDARGFSIAPRKATPVWAPGSALPL